jgi:ATP-dependent protease ClpP protease subunit
MLMKILVTLLSTLLIGAAAQAAEIKLTTGNTVVFRGAVDGGSITKAQLKLAELATTRGKAQYPIYLVLDSPGGSIVAGDAFIQYAKTIPNVHTITIFAASMAAGIVESLPGKRYMAENGILMFHRASGSFEGQFEEGELESQLALWKHIVRSMEQRNADRLQIPLATYKQKVVNEYWLYGQQALVDKAADEMATITCSQQLTDERESVMQHVFVFSVKKEFSGCPLFRAPISTESAD